MERVKCDEKKKKKDCIPRSDLAKLTCCQHDRGREVNQVEHIADQMGPRGLKVKVQLVLHRRRRRRRTDHTEHCLVHMDTLTFTRRDGI